MEIKFQKSHTGYAYGLQLTTVFEKQYGVMGTHIPTDKPRDYIGMPGEILIDDEVSREQPYAKIGDGKTSFDGLDYIKVMKDYYGTY
jgi:hypothetical protein